jgi:putative SOS response-associated peptidase YedK
VAFAGLWENWRSPGGEWVRSFTIVTTAPNGLCAELHNRMPAVLAPAAWRAWLGEEPADPSRALSIRGDDVLAGERAGRQRQEQ